jgi:hypothetical protein
VYSPAGVRYFDGFGSFWNQTRSWSNGTPPSSDNGSGIIDWDRPYLLEPNGNNSEINVNNGPWTIVRQVAYDYYDGTGKKPYGNLGDLRTATTLDGNNNVIEGAFPLCGHPASRVGVWFGLTCGSGGLMWSGVFNSSGMSGATPCQSNRRSRAMVARMGSSVSCQRPVNAAARSSSIPSALSTYHSRPLPFRRRFTTRRCIATIIFPHSATVIFPH